MRDDERRALQALRFDLAPTPDDVWRSCPVHVAEQNKDAMEIIFEGVELARSREDGPPLGVVIQGPSGAGKTHLLGGVRSRIQNDGGFFFLVSLYSGKTFWESTALCLVDALLREHIAWPTQLKAFLRRLAPVLGLPAAVRDAVAGDTLLRPADLDTFVAALRRHDRVAGLETQDTARALILHGSKDLAAQDLGFAYLNSLDLAEHPERAQWGLGPGVRAPQLIVRDISRLFALSGSPSVIAFDQLDTVVAQSRGNVVRAADVTDAAESAMLAGIADGLLMLREVTRRTLVVLACLPDTWASLARDAATPVPDRFRAASTISRIGSPKIGMAMVRRRLEARYGEVGFHPPYPTWPIKELAFIESVHFTPRALLKRVERHAAECVATGSVTELERLDDGRTMAPPPPRPATDAVRLAEMDERFATLVLQAKVDDALDHTTEDQAMPALLAAGFACLVEELADKSYRQDPLPSARPPLHARLRQTLDEGLEDERHWGMRAIASDNANAVITRVRAASTMAGLDPAVPKRRLFLLRNHRWPTGPITTQTVSTFHAAGGRTIEVAADDLKVFAALATLRQEQPEHLPVWLVHRRPASRTALVRTILSELEELGDSPERGQG